MKPDALIEKRLQTHGDWPDTARIARRLKEVLADELAARRGGVGRLADTQREALDMILAKIARILAGDPHHPDHWDDIAGYAWLGKGTGDG